MNVTADKADNTRESAQADADASDVVEVSETRAVEAAETPDTLYPQVWAVLNAKRRAQVERLTPFARELQLWIWSRPGPEMTHPELAQLLGVSPNTVNAWFGRRGTLPKAVAYFAVKELTGWSTARMLQLTNNVSEPRYVPTVWTFLHNDAAERFGYDALFMVEVQGWLDEAKERYITQVSSRERAPKNGGNGGKTANNKKK